jgi:hypothetical protein
VFEQRIEKRIRKRPRREDGVRERDDADALLLQVLLANEQQSLQISRF